MDCYKRLCSGLALVAIALLIAGSALAGSVTGTVKYEGSVPKLKPINMSADPGCAKKHSSPPMTVSR